MYRLICRLHDHRSEVQQFHDSTSDRREPKTAYGPAETRRDLAGQNQKSRLQVETDLPFSGALTCPLKCFRPLRSQMSRLRFRKETAAAESADAWELHVSKEQPI